MGMQESSTRWLPDFKLRYQNATYTYAIVKIPFDVWVPITNNQDLKKKK